MHYTPTLAWLIDPPTGGHAPRHKPRLVFVLDWVQRPDKHASAWWALIAAPSGGDLLPPSMEVRWEAAERLLPAEVLPPK